MKAIELEKVDWTFLNGGSPRYSNVATMRESIEKVSEITDVMGGLLEPIAVAFRPRQERPYEIIYGATRAVVQAKRGVKTVVALVYSGLTDRQIAALRFIENEHRVPLGSAAKKQAINDFVYASMER